MALQDLEPLWSFFLQKLRKCLAPRYEELKSRQDILFEVTYEAYLSSVYDVLENPLNEFAYLERLLVLNNYEETSSSVIRVKSQKNFVMKIQTINADIAKKCSVNNVFTSDTSGVQQLFLVLNEVARIEQLQSNCKTLEAFTHILIASLVPLISLGACKYKVCDNTGKLKFVEQFQPIYEQAKTRDDGFFLLNSITSFLLVTEKSKDILKNLCKLSDQEEVNKGLEAVLARLKLITANLKRKMTPILLTMPCHDEIEQKQFTSKENINHYHNFLMAAPSAALSSTQLTPFSSESQEEKHKTQTVDLETRNLNCFLLKASTSLKNSVKMTKKAVPSVNLEEAQDKNNIKNCNFPLLYHIEKVIKDELANSAVNTAQFTLSTIVSEYLLMDHIKGLRSILFMQNGIVMEQFCIELVRKVNFMN